MSNENENTSPLVQAAVEAISKSSNFEVGASKMASGLIRQTQGTSSAPKVIAEESAEQINELRAPPGTLPVPAAPAGGGGGSNYRGPLGAGGARRPRGPINRAAATTVASRGSTAKAVLKTAGKVATPLVAGYGAYQGYNFNPNAPTSRRVRDAAQQAAQYTVDLPRTGAALVGLGALGASKLGVPGAEDFAGQAFEWGERKGWIPNLEKIPPAAPGYAPNPNSIRGPVAQAPAAPAPNRRNIRGVQDRINRDKALDAQRAEFDRRMQVERDRIDKEGLKAGDGTQIIPPKASKPSTAGMSDEQKYGKTGAEIIRIGGMEAYKNRPKDARGNLDYLNKLKSDQRAAQISAGIIARAQQTPLNIPEPRYTPNLIDLQTLTPSVTIREPGLGIFRRADTGEKTKLRKAIPNEFAAIFSPRSRAEQKQKKYDLLQPVTVTGKRTTPRPVVKGPIEEQSDANYDMINRDALPVPSYRNIRGVQDRINADARKTKIQQIQQTAQRIKQEAEQRKLKLGAKPVGVGTTTPILSTKPMPLPSAGGDPLASLRAKIDALRNRMKNRVGGGMKKLPAKPGMSGGMQKLPYFPPGAQTGGSTMPLPPARPGTMGESVSLNESAMLLEQYVNHYGPELVYEQLAEVIIEQYGPEFLYEQINEVLVEQYGEDGTAEIMIESIVEDFNQRELTNEEFAFIKEESDIFVSNMRTLSEDQLYEYFETLDEEQIVYAVQLSSLNEEYLVELKKFFKKAKKFLKKAAKVVLPIAAGFLLPGIGGAIAGKLGSTALGTAVKGLGSKLVGKFAATGLGKAVGGLAGKVMSSGIGSKIAGALGNAAQGALTKGAISKVTGGSFSQGAKAGAIGGLAGSIGNEIGGQVAQSTGSDRIGRVVAGAIGSGIENKAMGGRFSTGAQYGGTSAVGDEIAGAIDDRVAAADEKRRKEAAERLAAQNRTAPSSTQAMAAESVKLDPVGREDADVNNDGKQDKTDVYLARKREKIGNAIAKRLGK